ncbi:hypothetical protein [Croceivirga thetidis]|uniref:DUF4890 domain-containing protein n=1 Tax=Croceivirga thetidis TaxID=2721623 RepID=A0ABX1GSZ2_9FLAO|nr:hypothetical protein [Croceivirga thetidis]NKI32125.1 hypothetical protein [Croceivirga thetidis]
MKNIIHILPLFIVLFLTTECLAQFGNPYGNPNMNRFGRGRTAIPQTQTPQKEPEPLTAEEYVDTQMPRLVETLELGPFEEAVMRTTLVKYVQKRMELQILQLEPQKMKEEFEKLGKLQNEELEAGLPPEKYEAYLKLVENPSKAERESKKSKRKRKKKEETEG